MYTPTHTCIHIYMHPHTNTQTHTHTPNHPQNREWSSVSGHTHNRAPPFTAGCCTWDLAPPYIALRGACGCCNPLYEPIMSTCMISCYDVGVLVPMVCGCLCMHVHVIVAVCASCDLLFHVMHILFLYIQFILYYVDLNLCHVLCICICLSNPTHASSIPRIPHPCITPTHTSPPHTSPPNKPPRA